MCTHSNAENIFIQLGFCKLAQSWQDSVVIECMPVPENERPCLCLPCHFLSLLVFFLFCFCMLHLNIESLNKVFLSRGPSDWLIWLVYLTKVTCSDCVVWTLMNGLFCASIWLSHIISRSALTLQIFCHVIRLQQFFEHSVTASIRHHHQRVPIILIEIWGFWPIKKVCSRSTNPLSWFDEHFCAQETKKGVGIMSPEISLSQEKEAKQGSRRATRPTPLPLSSCRHSHSNVNTQIFLSTCILYSPLLHLLLLSW